MPQTKFIHLRQGGRITLPAEFRIQLNMDEHTPLKMTLVGHEIRLRPVRVSSKNKGSAWTRELYQQFAPVRREAKQYSEREIDADIERAVRKIRGRSRSRRARRKE